MNLTKRLILSAVLVLLFLFTLTACHDPNEDVEEYAMIVTAEDISQLEMFPNLKYVDLRGSSCYEEIKAYIAAHPDVTVRYNVEIGSVDFEFGDSEIEIKSYEFEYENLLDNLHYLPEVEKVMLPNTDLTADQLETLRNTYPDVTFDCSVEIAGTEYYSDTVAADISACPAADIEEASVKLQVLPNLTSVRVSGDLTLEDVLVLRSKLPTVDIDYTATLFGQEFSTSSDTIIFDEAPIGNEGVDQIRLLLQIAPNLDCLILDDCGIDSAVVAQLRSEFPDTEIAWRVFIGPYSMLTNEEMVYMTYDVNNKNASELAYCNKVKYMNISNSTGLTDLSFLADMTEMEILLLSNTRISDISVVANMPNLECLELIYCNDVSDLSPLSGLKNLKYLNTSYTSASDLSPLDDLPLQMFCAKYSPIPSKELTRFRELHPDCYARFDGDRPYGAGWHYSDNEGTLSEIYLRIREVFRYDDPGFTGNRKED